MRSCPVVPPLLTAVCVWFLVFAGAGGHASGPVSGDLDYNGGLDVADYVALVAIVDSGTTMPTGAAYYADANQDNIIDTRDARFVLDVILGLATSLRMVDESAATSVSFLNTGSPSEKTLDGSAKVAVSYLIATPTSQEAQDGAAKTAVCFWDYQPPAPPTGKHTVLVGAPSFSRE